MEYKDIRESDRDLAWVRARKTLRIQMKGARGGHSPEQNRPLVLLQMQLAEAPQAGKDSFQAKTG